MISAERRERIEAVLQQHLGPFGYASAHIEDRPNSDGDPSIYILASFQDPSHLPSATTTVDAMVALRDALLEEGDERFPYLRYVYPEEPGAEAA